MTSTFAGGLNNRLVSQENLCLYGYADGAC